jgi:methyl-accepting chemotaxis protein
LADGDLDRKIFNCDGHDELHMAGNDFNDMAAAFRNLLGPNSDVMFSNCVARQTNLLPPASRFQLVLSEQSDSASSMAASVEEMTVGVDNIAKNALDAQGYSRESDDDCQSRVVMHRR